MRTTPLVMAAAALTAIGYGLVLPPTAHAIPSCAEQLNMLAAATGTPVDPAIMAQCQAAMANPQYQQQHQAPSQAPPPSAPGPCTPAAPGVNGNCGFTYSQCAVGALTGVGPCPGGAAGAPPKAPPLPVLASPTPPAAPPTGPEVNVPQAPTLNGPNQINDGTPPDPGQCANLDYYVKFELYCATVSPPPAGWHPGMGS